MYKRQDYISADFLQSVKGELPADRSSNTYLWVTHKVEHLFERTDGKFVGLRVVRIDAEFDREHVESHKVRSPGSPEIHGPRKVDTTVLYTSAR